MYNITIDKSNNVSARYNRLRQSLAKIGYACKGSLATHSMPCGRSGCRCNKGRRHWHGPYFDWSWKVRGKSKAVRLTPKQGKLMRRYVQNDRKLRRIVAEMRTLSLKVVQAQLKAVAD